MEWLSLKTTDVAGHHNRTSIYSETKAEKSKKLEIQYLARLLCIVTGNVSISWLQQIELCNDYNEGLMLEKSVFFFNFTMSLLYMDNQLCDMFPTIVRSRKTKQTSHLPTWLVSVDFQQLQFLAFLSLTFSSLSFSTRKERVVNICYIIAKIYSICAELFSDYTPMIPYGVR